MQKNIFFLKREENGKIIKNFSSTLLSMIFLIWLFVLYVNFVTYKGNFEGIRTLYVKMDGGTGTVLKVNNKYLKKKIVIKNSKNLSYGFYLIKYEIKNIKEKSGFITLNGKILGYKESKLNSIRKYISDIFDELFITENNLYAFSKTAVLGEKSYMSKDMNDKFKYTGLAHLTVISGTHISLVIMGIIKILDKINAGYKMKYILALTVLTFYCTVIGMSSGILRAYIMGAIMILARILFEQEDSKKSLLISAIIIVVLNPYSIFDISVQLSYAAVIAIIFVYPVFEKVFKEKYFDKIQDGIWKDTVKLLFLSLSVQIVSTPLFLYYFDKLPLFSFLLNIIGVPLGTVLIEFLFGTVFLNILKLSIFNSILIIFLKIIYNAFEGFIYIGSKLPFLQTEISIKVNIYFVIIYYMLLLIILFSMRDRCRSYINAIDCKVF
ncbi:ComEC/Rec2 family competence protein [Leptotrichia sp. OH3620_COT-345]|uniref:ComEC/Rec2 family competence protein n=1 Tax=Leptotrichia sp. OH3620_COT-345 TaxID=2491048 RepID=UPI000F650197|nr:ComEC/Rec2 family competence protein [Leptotrichia sp. OH3620_COT-345]RRD40669.1 ComEC/Rec2 family competence protein [Leptotrichia sp. OH3620_COT-345]